MAQYNFNLKNNAIINNMRSQKVYECNMAENYALLSNDPSVIRRFYQVEVAQFLKDTWLADEYTHKFMANNLVGNAFAYFGIIPMVVNGKVNLLASNGFECESDDKEINNRLNEIKEGADMDNLFADGVYWESGIGDFLYRVGVNKKVSDKPLIDVIEPKFFEVNYRMGRPISFVIKTVCEDDPSCEFREIYGHDSEGYAKVEYRFWYEDKYVPLNDEALMEQCRQKFAYMDLSDFQPITFPFKELPVIYKKNNNRNMLYRGERGVPDIQGLASIEDALTETISDLIDAIRKGGIKEWISEELIPQTVDGQKLPIDPFNRRILTTKGSSSPLSNEEFYKLVQGDINWEAYTRTIQNLMSVAINKVGLAPTTLGLTGLESINSSAESQDAREKTSMRTRELCLKEWQKTLKELMNRYLQVWDYMKGLPIVDYSDLIEINFPDYTNPTIENVTQVLAQQVNNGLRSRKSAIMELNDDNEGIANEEMKLIEQENLPTVEEKNVNLEGEQL